MATRIESPVEPVLQCLERRFDEFRGWLEALCRIPSVSAEGFPAEELQRSAGAVTRCMREAGLENVRTLEIEGAPPYAYGDRLRSQDVPTLLLYGHHDVQPAGTPERWSSPPFTPTERFGRLYGRGTVDDKGGIVALLAAVRCWLEAAGSPACNIKVLVDGEEEVGSPHLHALLQAHRDDLAADAVVVMDTPNVAVGSPAITCRLRGMCLVEVEVHSLRQPLHSGRGAGVVPDPVQVLCALIAGLQREDGRIDVPGFYRRVSAPSNEERERIRAVPFDEARFRNEVGLLDGVAIEAGPDGSVFETL